MTSSNVFLRSLYNLKSSTGTSISGNVPVPSKDEGDYYISTDALKMAFDGTALRTTSMHNFHFPDAYYDLAWMLAAINRLVKGSTAGQKLINDIQQIQNGDGTRPFSKFTGEIQIVPNWFMAAMFSMFTRFPNPHLSQQTGLKIIQPLNSYVQKQIAYLEETYQNGVCESFWYYVYKNYCNMGTGSGASSTFPVGFPLDHGYFEQIQLKGNWDWNLPWGKFVDNIGKGMDANWSDNWRQRWTVDKYSNFQLLGADILGFLKNPWSDKTHSGSACSRNAKYTAYTLWNCDDDGCRIKDTRHKPWGTPVPPNGSVTVDSPPFIFLYPGDGAPLTSYQFPGNGPFSDPFWSEDDRVPFTNFMPYVTYSNYDISKPWSPPPFTGGGGQEDPCKTNPGGDACKCKKICDTNPQSDECLCCSGLDTSKCKSPPPPPTQCSQFQQGTDEYLCCLSNNDPTNASCKRVKCTKDPSDPSCKPDPQPCSQFQPNSDEYFCCISNYDQTNSSCKRVKCKKYPSDPSCNPNPGPCSQFQQGTDDYICCINNNDPANPSCKRVKCMKDPSDPSCQTSDPCSSIKDPYNNCICKNPDDSTQCDSLKPSDDNKKGYMMVIISIIVIILVLVIFSANSGNKRTL